MDDIETIAALAALAQPTRLATFRLLVTHEPDGLPAGDVGRILAVPQNTMSAHLSVLARAGLVTPQRRGRSIIYRADLGRFRAMTLHLVEDCCGGRPDVCGPVVDHLPPRTRSKASCP